MTNNIGVEQSGKSGGDAFGHSTSGVARRHLPTSEQSRYCLAVTS